MPSELNGRIKFWVDGKLASSEDGGCGNPICVGCQKIFKDGLIFEGNGAVCRQCLDRVRNELWEKMGHAVGAPAGNRTPVP